MSGQLVLAGTTSGSITFQTPDVAGQSFLTIPAGNSTILTSNATTTINSNTSPLNLQTNGTNALTIDTSQNVGIGGTPVYKLDIMANTNSDLVQRIYNANTGTSSATILQLSTGTSRYVNFNVNYTNQYLVIAGSGITSVYNDFDTQIFRNTSGTERVRITSAGGVSFGSSGTAYGTTGQVLTSQGNAPPIWTTPSSTTTIDGSGTSTPVTGSWTKPSAATWVMFEMWGGGGAGGVGVANGAGGGGGGGSYTTYTLLFDDLTGTVSYSVAQGAAGTNTPSSVGVDGSPTSITISSYKGGSSLTLSAYGGGGGSYAGGGGGGGGGGGWLSAGTAGTTGATTGGSGGDGYDNHQGNRSGPYCGGDGGNGSGGSGWYSHFGGGGGGAALDGAGTGANFGGSSVYGGGGGGGAPNSGTVGPGGTSIFGGNGGAGSTGAAVAVSGTLPGGGGGGAENGTSGAGAPGRLRITYW